METSERGCGVKVSESLSHLTFAQRLCSIPALVPHYIIELQSLSIHVYVIPKGNVSIEMYTVQVVMQ